MKRMRTMNAVRIALAAVLLLAVTATPALAVGRPAVPNHAIIWGHDLYGMSEASATAQVKSAYYALKPITVKYGTKRWTFNPRAAVTLDLDMTVGRAYQSRATTAPFSYIPVYHVNATRVRTWVAAVAKQLNRAPVNARYYLYRGTSIRIVKARNGAQMRTAWCGDVMLRAIRAEMATGKPQTVLFTCAPIVPKVTSRNLGKVILVRLTKRHLWLYRPTGLERDYRIAVGTASHPTPRGTWRIVRKVMNPSWTNPGSAWASNMPSYIPPGPSNPLGTRALYLNASGIRIHGTNNIASVGTAASHGCMRMVRRDVENFYPRVPIGTPVWIVR